tara:strand:+ start:85 stop:312 length:228 start_codon:yes stop_codon:yes gene_type:complete
MSNLEQSLGKRVGNAMSNSYNKGQEAGVIRLTTALINMMNDKNIFSIDFEDIQRAVEITKEGIRKDMENQKNEVG